MVEAGCSFQATESNQAPKGDDAGKTIEFLRARLLAERAASKSARQQAQEIAEKVKDLHSRLETEIEHRKEAEAAVKKVFSVLKAKGVTVDAGNVLASTGLNGQSLREVSSSAHVEVTKEVSEKLPYIANVSIKEEVPCSLGNRNAYTQNGIAECTSVGTTELYGNLSAVVDSTCSPNDGVGINPISKNGDVPSTNSGELQHCPTDKVQDAHIEEKVVCPDHNDLPHCTLILEADDVATGQSLQQGLCFTSKLKAMLQQIGEEVGALPEEQPLRDKLKGWVDHAANMLDGGKGAASKEALETHQSNNSNQTHANCRSKGVTALETKNVTHTKMAIQSNYADAFQFNEAGQNPVNQVHHIAQGPDQRSELKSLFPAPKAQPQQRQSVPLTTTTDAVTTTANASTRKDKLLHSNMSQPCEYLNGGNIAACVAHCPGPLAPQMLQYEQPHSKMTPPPSIIHGSHILKDNNYMGSESSYIVEAPSPKSSDAPSIRNKMGDTHGQHQEFWSPARASELEGQNAWPPARLQSQPRAMLSKGTLMNELSDELLMKLKRGYTHENTHFQGGHSFSRSAHFHQAGDVRNYNRFMAIKQTKDHLPFEDAAFSMMNDRNERLGRILMALNAARHYIQDDDFHGPPTPRSADVRLKRGYGYGDLCVQQLPPPEVRRDHTWRSQAQSSVSHAPSPTSEHEYGYSPFERSPGAHRRSSSVSTNFMMSERDNYLQLRGGEIHLGNGITLFTD